MKIVIVGGGSYCWTPRIFRDIVQTPFLEGAEIVLQDINANHLKDLHACCASILDQLEKDKVFKLSAEMDHARALRRADAVVLTITTGAYESMEGDLRIPYKYGIYQPVGDTVGPGGICRSLRNIPVVVDIARIMERVCPNAWLVNLTNPMSTLVRAVWRETNIRCVGLCHELYETLHVVEKLLDAKDWRKEFVFSAVGVNHLPWITELEYNGKDAFPEIRRRIAKGAWDNQSPEGASDIVPTGASTHRVKRALFEAYGVLPAATDRHVCEFFPFFCTDEMDRGAAMGVELTTIEERRKVFTPGWKKDVRNITKGTKRIEPEVSEEAASKVIAALLGGGDWKDVVNIPNEGQVPELPLGAIVETMGLVQRDRISGLPVGDVPIGVLTQLERHIANQELTVEAALTGDRSLALQAMLGDPLCGSIRRFGDMAEMLDAMLKANRKWLPLFFKDNTKKKLK